MKEPVLILMDKDGYLISAGNPEYANIEEIGKCLKEGGTVNTIEVVEYRASEYKWVFSKQK